MILFTFNIIFAADLTFFSSSSMSFWNCCCFRSENTVCIFQSLCVSLLFCCVGVGGDDRVVFMDHSCLGFSPKPVPPLFIALIPILLDKKEANVQVMWGYCRPYTYVMCVQYHIVLCFINVLYYNLFRQILYHPKASNSFFFPEPLLSDLNLYRWRKANICCMSF